MNIQQRLQAPTPRFFKKVRTVGLILAAISGTLMTTPIALPLVVVKAAGYLAVAGAVASAVSQVTTTNEDEKPVIDGYQYPH